MSTTGTVRSINADWHACQIPVKEWTPDDAEYYATTQVCSLRSAHHYIVHAARIEAGLAVLEAQAAASCSAYYRARMAESLRASISNRLYAEAAYARYATIDRMLAAYAARSV